MTQNTPTLQTNAQRYEALLKTVPCGIEEIDTEGNLLFASPGYAKLMGYTCDELRGMHLTQLIPEEERERVMEDIQTLVEKQPEPTPYNHTFLRKDKTRIHAQVNWNYIRDKNDLVTGFIVVISDISELEKARQETEQALSIKSNFLSSMSHEIRTPLNSILGFSQLIEKDVNATEEIQDNIQEVLSSGKHLLSLINDLLELSLLESGKFAITQEAVDIEEAINTCLSLFRDNIEEKAITVIISELAGHHVYADPKRITQILLNVISNAIKYNKNGGEIRITAHVKNEKLRINVSDTGIGIPKEKFENVFMPFDRLGHERSKIKGSGIGLSISKELAKAMDCDISFTSKENQGTSFRLDAPLCKS